ncbi:MAG: hypothetical protein M1820_007964 [Bogoriella megaspora]|nr:MAG: hypothetical protein M1820_007964 [Bogoriella megaspora]
MANTNPNHSSAPISFAEFLRDAQPRGPAYGYALQKFTTLLDSPAAGEVPTIMMTYEEWVDFTKAFFKGLEGKDLERYRKMNNRELERLFRENKEFGVLAEDLGPLVYEEKGGEGEGTRFGEKWKDWRWQDIEKEYKRLMLAWRVWGKAYVSRDWETGGRQ